MATSADKKPTKGKGRASLSKGVEGTKKKAAAKKKKHAEFLVKLKADLKTNRETKSAALLAEKKKKAATLVAKKKATQAEKDKKSEKFAKSKASKLQRGR